MDGKYSMRSQNETFVFKFLRRSVDGIHLIRLQSENSFFKFLRSGVNRLKLGLVIELIEGSLHEADHLQAASA